MITMSLLSFGLLTACGDKEEDTAVVTDTADTEETDTEDTSDTEETDTEETDTEETDTEETDTEEPDPVDADMDGFTDDVDCDDSNADINPDAWDNPENDVDEDCNGTPASIVPYDSGLMNASFETAGTATTDWGGELPDAWMNIGNMWATQAGAGTLYGDNGDSGEVVAAPDGDKYVKIWPDAGANPYGDESPVYQEWAGGADMTFYISALGMVHNSSALKGATEAVVWIKCFDPSYAMQGDAQSVALTASSTLDEWTHQYATVTCGPNTTLVQAVLSLNTPDEDVDGNGTVDAGESQTTGNVYYDHVMFGLYSNDAAE
jgi:hypothetical protein